MILSINGSSIDLSSLGDVLISSESKLHDLKSSAPILFISTLARLLCLVLGLDSRLFSIPQSPGELNSKEDTCSPTWLCQVPSTLDSNCKRFLCCLALSRRDYKWKGFFYEIKEVTFEHNLYRQIEETFNFWLLTSCEWLCYCVTFLLCWKRNWWYTADHATPQFRVSAVLVILLAFFFFTQ